MKYRTLIIGFIILYSCQTTQDSSDNEDGGLQSDTISITLKRYSLPDENPDIFDYNLIREKKGDSLLSFSYYKDTVLSRHYNFNIRQGRFELIQDKVNPELAIVDTIEFHLLNEYLIVFKYEVRIPSIDGDAGFLFNQKYGLMGYSSYSWGNKTVLTNWDDSDFEKEITGILLADTVRYLRRHEIILPPSTPPPGQFGKIEIVEDTVEIEIEEEKNVWQQRPKSNMADDELDTSLLSNNFISADS